MMNARSFKAAVLAFATAFLPLAAFAAIAPGTQFSGTLDRVIDSGSAQVGDPFVLSNVQSADGTIAGARIYGRVAEVRRAGQGARPQVRLAFDRLVTAHGYRYDLNARVTGMTVNTKSNTGREVLTSVGGMLLGNILGKAVGTNMGGLLGAAGGFLYAKNYKNNVSVPAGSTITLQVIRAAQQSG
ncbi:MAG: hypothetical protein WCE44_11140 [Candidatus Velthaea sp.]|jgi:hypothetical protein